MKKKLWIITAVVLLCGIVFAAVVGALDNPIQTSGGYDYMVNGATNTITIMSVDPSVAIGDVVIPDTLDGYTVSIIGDSAFADCAAITGITIPATVESIGLYAFSGCTDIESVTIPASVKSVGEYAFYDCIELTKVNFQESSNPVTIGEHAFGLCEALNNVVIPANVTSIGSYAFEECASLTKITILNDSITIDADAFYLIDDLTVYGNAGSNAEEYANSPENDNITFQVIGAAPSYTISGKITAAEGGKVTLTLMKGETEKTVEITIDATTKTGSYSFTVEEAGEYTLRVSMDKHVTREYTVLVGGED